MKRPRIDKRLLEYRRDPLVIALKKRQQRQQKRVVLTLKLGKERWNPNLRLTSKWVLMRGLLEEMEKGNSLTKLYAGLLAQAMLDQDAKLRARYGAKLQRTLPAE
jgi:hypothetical protein